MKTVALYGLAVLSLGAVAGAVALKAQTDQACPAGGVGSTTGAAAPCCGGTAAPTDKTTLTGTSTAGELPACCPSSTAAGEGCCGGSATLAGHGGEKSPFGGGCPYTATMASEGGCGGGSACEKGCGEGKDCGGEKEEASVEPTVVDSKDSQAKPSASDKAS